jgi:hypothetical protein
LTANLDACAETGVNAAVLDGHHRISVSRALGWQAITASIEVWQVDQPVASADRIRERRPAVGHRRAGSSRRLGGWLRISIAAAVSGLLGPAGAAAIEAG